MYHSLKITTDKDGCTQLFLDGMPMQKGGLRFSLEQKGGEIPVLHLDEMVDEVEVEADRVEVKRIEKSKVEALVDRILQECEQEGLTPEAMGLLPMALHYAIINKLKSEPLGEWALRIVNEHPEFLKEEGK